MTTLTFDTSSVDGRDRFSYWNDALNSSFCVADNRPSDEEHFAAKMTTRALGGVHVNRIESSPMHVERSSRSVKRDLRDDFLCGYFRSGSWYVEQDGQQAVATPGDLLLMDMGSPYTHTLPTDYEAIFLRIPRHLVRSRTADDGLPPVTVLPRSSSLGALIGTLLTNITESELPEDGGIQAQMASGVLELVGAGFDSVMGQLPVHDNQSTLLLAAAKRFIRENLADPSLTVEDVANACHVSRRTLNRLFAGDGTTAIRWMWDMRLDRSRRMLESGGVDRVTALALECGFSDFSHFSRSFKRTYGVAPSSLVRRGTAV